MSNQKQSLCSLTCLFFVFLCVFVLLLVCVEPEVKASPLLLQVVYKNNDVRLELSRLARQGDPKMKVGAFPAASHNPDR